MSIANEVVPEVELQIARVASARPEAAVAEARAHLEAVSGRYNPGPPGYYTRPWDFPAAPLRRALEARHEAAARLALIEALAAGSDPPPWPTAEALAAPIAAELLGGFATAAGPPGVAWLVGKLGLFLDEDLAELVELDAKIGYQASAYASGHHDTKFPELAEAIRGLIVRRLTIEARHPGRRDALDAWRSEFAKRTAAAVGKGLDALVSGLYEAHSLADRLAPPDPALAETERGLAAVNADLDKLGGTAGTIAPGPITASLKDQRKDLEKRLKALRGEQGRRVESDLRALAERVAAGDLESWTAVAGWIAAHPGAFPAELGERLVTAGVGAWIATAPLVWAGALESATHGGRGRDGDF
jgi:hypothetical protein